MLFYGSFPESRGGHAFVSMSSLRMKRLGPLLCLLLAAGCASLVERDRLAQTQRTYLLPWAAGETHRCIQSGPGSFSHSGKDEFAVDFKMEEGTLLLAAREGRVLAVKEDSDRGGPDPEFIRDGNYVQILHEDGTRAIYLHLQRDGALVTPGEVVPQGAAIARSGSTGWSTTPHLHFAVERWLIDARKWQSIPFAFREVPGPGVPLFLGAYRSANVAATTLK